MFLGGNSKTTNRLEKYSSIKFSPLRDKNSLLFLPYALCLAEYKISGRACHLVLKPIPYLKICLYFITELDGVLSNQETVLPTSRSLITVFSSVKNHTHQGETLAYQDNVLWCSFHDKEKKKYIKKLQCCKINNCTEWR